MQEQNNWDGNGNYGKEAHPPAELLMLSVDGELPPDEAARIESHLAACWVCRARTAKIEATITDFIEYRQAALAPHLTPPPSIWRNFQARLDMRAEELGRPPLMARLGARLRGLLVVRLTPARSAVAASAAIVAVAGFWLSRSPIASANELLERSMQAEMTRINQVAEPVMYRRLQARRKSAGVEESITWESWHSAKDDLFRQRVADKEGMRFIRSSEELGSPLLNELERVFRANRLDARRPLSAGSFADWRKTVRLESETVTEVDLEDRNPALKLTTFVAGPHVADSIVEASLVIRRSDWRPVAQHFKVQGQSEVQEYELSEIAYEVMPLAALTVFAQPAPAPLPIATPGIEVLRTPAVPSPPVERLPTELELREAEVAALYALHRAQADLGEQIEISRDQQSASGEVIVRGLAETADRKEQLIEALRGIPLIRTRILTVEEARILASQQAAVSQPEPAAVSTADARAGSLDRESQRQAFRLALESYFASSGGSSAARITGLTNKSLALSESALARAWALRRLAENSALKDMEQLSAETRARLKAMLESHLKELTESLRSLQSELDPCLTFIAGGRPAGGEATAGKSYEWTEAALLAFQSISQLDRRLHGMFSPDGPAGGPAVVARQVLTDFAEIEKVLRLLEIQTSRIAAKESTSTIGRMYERA